MLRIVLTILLTLLWTFRLAQDNKQLWSVTNIDKIEKEQVLVNEQNGIEEYLKLIINLPIKTSGTYKENWDVVSITLWSLTTRDTLIKVTIIKYLVKFTALKI